MTFLTLIFTRCRHRSPDLVITSLVGYRIVGSRDRVAIFTDRYCFYSEAENLPPQGRLVAPIVGPLPGFFLPMRRKLRPKVPNSDAHRAESGVGFLGRGQPTPSPILCGSTVFFPSWAGAIASLNHGDRHLGARRRGEVRRAEVRGPDRWPRAGVEFLRGLPPLPAPLPTS